MSRFKWNLWFLTVTFGYFLLLVGTFTNFAEVGADTLTGSSPTSITSDTDGKIRKGGISKLLPTNARDINSIKSSTEVVPKAKTKQIEEESRRNDIGYAAEWEYKGSGLEELDESSETKHQEKLVPSSRINPKNKMDHVPHYPSLSPSRRLGPGSWLDSNGYWWVFGGQGPSASVPSNKTSASSIYYLSDLWVYGPPRPQTSVSVESANSTTKRVSGSTGADQNPYWRLVYRPENDGESPLSSHPENVLFPLLCGSKESEHLALFGGGGQVRDPMFSSTYPKSSEKIDTEGASKSTFRTVEDETTHNSLFTEDSVVWLYDIPKSFEKIPRRTVKSGGGNACNWSGKDQQQCNETGTGLLWTSYLCCDACLPDGNTTFDFCPQFSREPILWCNQDSLMAFQLTLTTATTTGESKATDSNDIKPGSDAEGKQPTFTVAPSTTSTESPSTLIFSTSSSKIPQVSQQRNITAEDILVAGLETEKGSLSSASHNSQNFTREDSFMSNGSNSQGVGQQGKAPLRERIGEENEKKAKSESLVNGKSPKSRKQQKSIVLVEERLQSMRQETKGKMNNNNNEELKKEINTRKVGVEKNTIGNTKEKLTNISDGKEESPVRRIGVNWWKFDLTSTEWIKMPEVNISEEDAEKVRSGSCRTVSDSDFLYILCPTKTNLLDRSVLLFDPSKKTVRPLGTIHLNNAFHDKKVWHLGRSVFHAFRSDNQTVICLAYHKLLDLWIHDHSSNRLIAVENVWKGSSLHAFQHTNSFYKLTIVLPPSSSRSTSGFSSSESSTSSKILKGTHHSFYMANPRSKLFTFDDPFPDGHFRINIVTDQAVFLPSRDAPYPYLINSTESSSRKLVYNPENSSTTFSKDKGEQVGNFSASAHDAIAIESTATSNATKTAQVPLTSESVTTAEKSPITKEYDQGLPIPISTYDPQPDPTLERSRSISQSESGFKKDEEETQIDKTNVPEGMRMVTGLRKAHGSSFNSTSRRNSNKSGSSIGVPTQTHTTDSDLFTSRTTRGDAAGMGMRSGIPDPTITQTPTTYVEESQSKPNPTLQRNYNKTNNSQLRSRVEVIPGGKKRILGIKRTEVVAKIDSHSFQNTVPIVPVGESMKSISNTTRTIITTNTTTSGNSGIHSSHSTNTIRSKAGRSSLPVNNESNRKPLSTSSESPANSTDTPGGVMKVLNSSTSYTMTTSTTTMNKTSENGDPVKAKNKTSSRTTKLEEWKSNRVRGVNLSNRSPAAPQASALKVAVQAEQPESLPANLGTKIDQVNIWTQSKNPKTQTSYSNIKNQASYSTTNHIPPASSMLMQRKVNNDNHNHHEDDDHDDSDGGGVDEDHHQQNLQNNYYISPMKKRRKLVSPIPQQTQKWKNESFLMSHSANESFMREMMDRDLSPLTYGSSEILIESPNDDIQSIAQDGDESYYTSYSTFGSLLFFSLSLSMFATFGLVLFVKRCVKCPPRSESVLLKEPPPIRYSVIPDELSFHTPIV